MNYDQLALQDHEKFHGKLAVSSKVPLENKDHLSTYYTPGVAAPCLAIADNPQLAYTYTWKSNSVAVVSDGSAVLGLGNIGGVAGLPVMEGKAILMKAFADIDAVPLVLDTQDPDQIIQIVKNIAPTFGAINLEDIKAPECFYIETELNKLLPIPVFHDDQHGTAIVVVAALINALKLTNKQAGNIKVAISGAGAAGIAVANLLSYFGVQNIVVVDSRGAIYAGREGLNPYKEKISAYNINNDQGSIHEVIAGADVFIGVSKPDLLTEVDIQKMNKQPIVFALSNPKQEITYEQAMAGGAYIYGSGRSDLPNQINNLLAFPGILRGALDSKIEEITMEHKLAAAHALANYIENPSVDYLLPDPLDKEISQVVAQAIMNIV